MTLDVKTVRRKLGVEKHSMGTKGDTYGTYICTLNCLYIRLRELAPAASGSQEVGITEEKYIQCMHFRVHVL